MIEGTSLGNLCGFLYFLIFLFGGMFLSLRTLSKQRFAVKLWLGCVFGLVLLMWLPVCVSFVIGFTKLSHYIALAALLIICAIVHLSFPAVDLFKGFKFDREFKVMLALLIPISLYYLITQANHSLVPSKNGGFIFGQSTYYDINIHLSFITTPVVQEKMPFDYNILPGHQVSYPFLCDTISSSVYIWGASLRFAYVMPTVFGAIAVFQGAFLFFSTWLKSLKKTVIAWLLFFFNGGFGFIYFLDGLRQDTSNFTRIFTELYQTPTNLFDKTVRWVNTICDMMIPQRATLFGWMILFACLYLLYKAVFEKEKLLFIPAGILAGLCPLISTHIFVSLAVISAVWMISRLSVLVKLSGKEIKYTVIIMLLAIIGAFVIKCLISGKSLTAFDYDSAGFYALIVGLIFLSLVFAGLLIFAIIKGNLKQIASTWGVYLAIVLVLALPQLILFTFNQSANSGFMRQHFNWVNTSDEYIWFYVKNVGIVALLIIPAAMGISNRNKSIIAPIAVMLLVADTFAFQPNTYDNNKLLYPVYALACGGVAEYMCILYEKIKSIKGSKLIAAFVIFLCVFSGTLSMGREIISGDFLNYSGDDVAAAKWVEQNCQPADTILTGDKYNNAISSLTGRNIVCGSSAMLIPHGFSSQYYSLQKKVKDFYESPLSNQNFVNKYNVDYILISEDELVKYAVKESEIKEIASLVYERGTVRIYKVN